MIEMVYKGKDKDGKDERRLPKNVRQIGEAGKGKKVYLEDYVVTYLHQVEAAVLLGETWEKDGSKYIFFHGGIQVDDTEFGENIWEQVYRDAREYFEDSEVLGWSMQMTEPPTASDQRVNRIFKSYFDREDTVLLLYEPMEKEDVIFAEENGVLKKTGGYYVYYDKNKSMQEYMVRKNEGKSVEKEEKITDRAIKSFRKISEEKKSGQEKEKGEERQTRNPRFIYAASTFLALTILVLGVTMISNYDKMKDMEMQISDMAKGTEGGVEANASAKEEARGKKDAETEKFTNGLSQTEVPDGNQEAGNSMEDQKASEGGEPGNATADNLSGVANLPNGTDAASAQGTDMASVPDTGSGMGMASTEGAGTDIASTQGTGTEAASAQENGADTAAPGTEDGAAEAASGNVRTRQAFYTVKDGDTLADICRMYYGTADKVEEICTFNNITDPNRILPGQKIKLP